ncbi:MAG: OmpA family protein, partial [Boseongicola sp.]|nr:OmpA family protein [Boseongicola sp.]
IRLVGHTDVSGPAEINKATGLARANAVAAALRGKITSPARIESVHSEGEDNVLPNIHPRDVLQRRVAIWARQC